MWLQRRHSDSGRTKKTISSSRAAISYIVTSNRVHLMVSDVPFQCISITVCCIMTHLMFYINWITVNEIIGEYFDRDLVYWNVWQQFDSIRIERIPIIAYKDSLPTRTLLLLLWYKYILILSFVFFQKL